VNITIVIPTYNEAENLPKLVSAIFALPMPDLKVLFVDDNSPDGTGDLAEALSKEYPGRIDVLHRPGKMGLGSAYLTGFRHAIEKGAQAVGQMDADFSHPIAKIPVLACGLECCDYVIGSRYVPGGGLDERWPLWRKGLSAWGNFYARTLLSLPIRDVTGGFRLWRAETLCAMPLERIRSNGYIFQVELAYIAHKLGFGVQEFPIYFADRRWGTSKMSFKIQVEAALRVWKLLLMYRDLNVSTRHVTTN
jgi:dolichol-phosphate mannosyltransferase